MADGRSGSVRPCLRSDSAGSTRAVGVAEPAGHRPCPAAFDAAVACRSSGSGRVSGRTVAMSAAAAAGGHDVSMLVAARHSQPDTRPRVRPPRTPAGHRIPAGSHVPDTCRPDGGGSGSSGRSIRRSLWLVTTSSAATAVDHAISRPTTKQRTPRHGGRPEADFGSPPTRTPAGPLAAAADTGRPAAFVADRDQRQQLEPTA